MNAIWNPWTEAQDDILRKNRDLSHMRLAKMVSAVGPARSDEAVKDRRRRLGLSHGSAWTEERVTRMLLLDSQGWSASQIARDLGDGLTRNGVIGKLHRLGVSKNRVGRLTATKAASTVRVIRMRKPPAPTAAARAFQHGGGCAIAGTGKPPQDIATAGPTAESLNLRITDEGFGGCRWPTMGESAETRFCCARTGGATYCAAHAKRAFNAVPAKGPRSDKELERSLRRYA